MRVQSLIYPISVLILLGMYAFFAEPGGFRLPRYYTPDGVIMPIGNYAHGTHAHAFFEIDGRDPSSLPALFPEHRNLFVTTEKGTGLMLTIPNDIWEIAYDFKVLILLSIVYLIAAVWFYRSTRDLHLAGLCFTVSLFFYGAVIVLAYHELQFFWMVTGFIMLPALLNMGFRTAGKEVSGFLLIGESIGILFLSLITYVGLTNAETLKNINNFSVLIFAVIIVSVCALQLQNALRHTEDPVERLKRWVLLAGSIIGVMVPYGMFQVIYVFRSPSIPADYIILISLLFPVFLVYGSYRLHIIPFQLVATRSLVAGLLTVLFVAVYGVALMIHSLLLPEQESSYQWIVNVVFILSLVFFLDPLRRFISRSLESRVFRLDARLSDSLKRIAQLISAHRRIQPAVNAFLQEVHMAVNVDKISFLFSHASFPDLYVKQGRLRRISHNSSIWDHLTPGRMIVTAYLAYGGGGAAELYNYLYKNNYMLAIGIVGRLGRVGFFQNGIDAIFRGKMSWAARPRDGETQESQDIRAALLVGYHQMRKKLTLKEIRYLQEAAKLAGMLIHNYSLLIGEIDKRRRMREIILAGQMQRSLPQSYGDEFANVHMAHFAQAAISVTGDYMDLVPLSRKSFAFFLADVSGHGLGTGYLASSIRSIVRSHLSHEASLLDTVQTLNLFLMDRYRGNEFITLFAFILNTESGTMEYINAAHPGPYIIRPRGELIQLAHSQRLVGVLPTPYHTERTRLEPGDKLFVYSDGVTETFNKEEIAFGESGLEALLLANRREEPAEIVRRLQRTLVDHRNGATVTDDTTCMMLEFAPRFNPVRGIFQLLGLERD